MNTREYLTNVKNILKAYEDAYGQPTYSEECENLNDYIFDLCSTIYKLTDQEKLKLSQTLQNKIDQTDPSDKKTLKLLKQAQGYLEFYSHCPVDYLFLTSGNRNELENLYNNSEWTKLFTQSNLPANIERYVHQMLIHRELKIAYNKVQNKTGCGFLCLDAYNHGALTSAIMSPKSLRLNICGPLSANENRKLSYSDPYKIRDLNGEYTTEQYKHFIDNNYKAINLYQEMIKMFEQIKRQDCFTGYFYTYNKNEIDAFADKEIELLNKHIAKIRDNIKSLQSYVNGKEY